MAKSVTAWWRCWPSWVGYVASGSAAGYGAALLAGAVLGGRSLVGVANLAWPGAAVLLVGSAAAAATVRAQTRPLPQQTISATLWGVAALSVAGSCFALLNLIELAVTGSVRDRDGGSDWLAFVQRVLLIPVGALFVATALSWRRRTEGACSRCGQRHPAESLGRRYPAAHPAPRAIRRLAYAGCGALAPYTVLHTLGALGYSGIEPDGFRPSWSAAVALYCGIALAVFLLLGLVRPWGMVFPRATLWLAGKRVPRFLPLTPAWVVAPTLALYGIGSLIYVGLISIDVVRWNGRVGLLGVAAPVAFAGYGCALVIAAVSYQRRTRPWCVLHVDAGGPSGRRR